MKKRITEEQVIRILREAEAPGAQIREVCRCHNVTEQTYLPWRRRFGGMDVPTARKLKMQEAENTWLQRIVAEQMLVSKGLKEFTEKIGTPLGRRQALEALSSRGLSERAACDYLRLSRRVTGPEREQPGKDKTHGDQLVRSEIAVGTRSCVTYLQVPWQYLDHKSNNFLLL